METLDDDNCDRCLVKKGYYSITPFKPSYEDEYLSKKLKEKIEK